jgi:hypothetical protein
MFSVDARAFARVAQNPSCRRQAAMLLIGLPEDQLRARLPALPREGPYGERAAALRWGVVFDRALAEGGASRLLASLDGQLGLGPGAASVRDLRAEVPGRTAAAVRERTRRVRNVLADLIEGRPVPDVLIQPPLELTRGAQSWGAIVPDALALDRPRLAYVPVEAKGNVSVDGAVPAADRGRMRLQAAVQVHALRAEFARLGQADRVTSRALLVVATPFGFRPAPGVLEDLAAEVEAVGLALRALGESRAELAAQPQSADPTQVLMAAPPNFREACLAGCALAEICRAEAKGVRGVVGDRAAELLGGDLGIARLGDLLGGSRPVGVGEEAALETLRGAASLFGWGG